MTILFVKTIDLFGGFSYPARLVRTRLISRLRHYGIVPCGVRVHCLAAPGLFLTVRFFYSLSDVSLGTVWGPWPSRRRRRQHTTRTVVSNAPVSVSANTKTIMSTGGSESTFSGDRRNHHLPQRRSCVNRRCMSGDQMMPAFRIVCSFFHVKYKRKRKVRKRPGRETTPVGGRASDPSSTLEEFAESRSRRVHSGHRPRTDTRMGRDLSGMLVNF